MLNGNKVVLRLAELADYRLFSQPNEPGGSAGVPPAVEAASRRLKCDTKQF